MFWLIVLQLELVLTTRPTSLESCDEACCLVTPGQLLGHTVVVAATTSLLAMADIVLGRRSSYYDKHSFLSFSFLVSFLNFASDFEALDRLVCGS
jgi:hypothetical protein